jgi:hypothetical protein
MFCPYLAQRPAVKELIGAESILQLSDLRGDGKLSRLITLAKWLTASKFVPVPLVRSVNQKLGCVLERHEANYIYSAGR